MCLNMLQTVPTGCSAIDKFLGGGIPSESISLIYGEAETGKTTFAIQCLISCALQGHKTLFVDCDGTFSAQRLSQIASEKFETVSELTVLMRPNNFQEQTLVIDQLPNYLAKNFGLVVFDTLTSLYRLKIAESPKKAFELNRELNRQVALLAQTARTQKIAVLTASQVHSVFDEHQVSIEPVATRVLKFWADTIINLKPTETPQTIKAVFEKTQKTKQAELPTFILKIDKTGMHTSV